MLICNQLQQQQQQQNQNRAKIYIFRIVPLHNGRIGILIFGLYDQKVD